MPSINVNAYAKVNWHLAVGEKRPDGYHSIASVFQKANLHDSLTVSVENGSSQSVVRGLESCVPAGKSTIDKAIALWRERTCSNVNISVTVIKRIPTQSGLGGGSSDAASVLLALNALSHSLSYIELSFDELCDIGRLVGCDVPFFLYECDAACVFGVGEEILPIKARHDLKGFVLVPNAEKTSTSVAYHALDERAFIPPLESADFLKEEYSKPYTAWNFRNDFEAVNKRPSLSSCLDGFALRGNEGEERLFLTGSGSCWVLLSNRESLYCNGYSVLPVSF